MGDTLLIPRRQWPEVTGQSQSNCDRATACGDILTTVVGRKRFATRKALEGWVQFLASASQSGYPIKYMARDESERRTPQRAQAERRKRKAGAR